MNLLTAAVVATLLSGTSAASCSIATLSKLLLDPYIDQCASDSEYSFTSGVQPTLEEVAGMCASDACHSLLADVETLNLTECTLPIGNNINLFADLIDYVSDQCDADTPAPPTATPDPIVTTLAPTPEPTAATPTPTTAAASCTSAQLRYLLTSSYQSQCANDADYSFTAPYAPTDTQVAAMCASSSCVSLFAYVSSMVTTDCRIPVGGKILLLADLVDYVTDKCDADTPAPTTEAPTEAPTETPEPTTATPTPTTLTPVASCAISVISALLTDPYIDQCAQDSGYSFTSGVQPDPEEVTGMCASSACASLLANVEAMGLSECSLPIGNKIYLFADLIDYVSDQCDADTPAPPTATPDPIVTTLAPTPEPPSTTAPITESPVITTPSPDASTTGSSSTGTPTTEPDTPTATETPEPTAPIHNSC
ncbi:hypothetical protein PHYBOEH_009013 [Phytophthora boehmeriae]|uniref:Elicitin n=1 Tax=Phytophthora boehmeriae TaxID=109152 RepID=A0A8T1VX17_9STRA|nr:hypothetical protein PHYBOEH_009013 [Phytophthora boehmeriae]